ncbi:hypothetical protein M758_6G157400 [Ceratodon purpureus]|uniref:Uncharacterized protein n=1 Tax=Ceratodon purpureus TaxID=3225 RepID=A0A8T0HFR4_CERPU|nr:hypothetical protein KC19_6G164200 [Ceratodon purpureus]KAG0614185.1 hypothetical protein M758_6G157400 [Ceratodon purpureus]
MCCDFATLPLQQLRSYFLKWKKDEYSLCKEYVKLQGGKDQYIIMEKLVVSCKLTHPNMISVPNFT